MRDLLSNRAFVGVEPGALNNFSTPSILNELAWAVGEASFDPELAIVEVGRDRWVDLHVTHNVKPATRELVLRRRAAIHEAYRSFRECRLVIVTLGLVEVWYDNRAGTYLNRIPPPSLIADQSDRFEWHMLTYEETLDHVRRAIDILLKHGHPEAQILLSLSPVAIGVTHADSDVMVANCYSKSVQRAAIEQLVAAQDRVHYFPSYESATLSDRSLAWADDFTHVTDALVSHNVERLVKRLSPTGPAKESSDAVRAEIEQSGAASAHFHAMEMRKASVPAADAFFEEFGQWSDRSPSFAVEHAEWLLEQRRAEEALAITERSGANSARMALARARALILLRRPQDALAVLRTPELERSRANRYWSMRVEAEGKAGALGDLETSLAGWCQAHPKRVTVARVHVARALLSNSSVTRALELLDLALVDQPENPLAHMLCAEAHILRGDLAAAEQWRKTANPQTVSENRRYEQLLNKLERARSEQPVAAAVT